MVLPQSTCTGQLCAIPLCSSIWALQMPILLPALCSHHHEDIPIHSQRGCLPTLLEVRGRPVFCTERGQFLPSSHCSLSPKPHSSSTGPRSSPRPSWAKEPHEKLVPCPPFYSPHCLPPQSAPLNEIAQNTPSRPRVQSWCMSLCADMAQGDPLPSSHTNSNYKLRSDY